MIEDAGDESKTRHDHVRVRHYLATTQDQIVNFSVEHFKARFWMSAAENRHLDLLFDKLRETWKLMRTPNDHHALLDDLRQEILRFDEICGLKTYNGGKWSHVALEP